ncbi:transglycosylase domain-containing protein [Gemmobacter lanyuensis]
MDLRALGRAVAQAVWNGRVVSGGSTLTMQVARLLEESGTGAVAGKLRQMRVALALEQRLTKAQILQLYLHLAPFGGNLEGVRAASLAYFGKEPRRLTPAEAALLVAIPQSPEGRRPDRHPGRAVAARDRVLERATRRAADGRGSTGNTGRTGATSATAGADARPHLADRAVRAAPSRPRHVLTLDAGVQRGLEGLARQAVADRGRRCRSPFWWPITNRAKSSPRSDRRGLSRISGRALSI